VITERRHGAGIVDLDRFIELELAPLPGATDVFVVCRLPDQSLRLVMTGGAAA